MDSFQLKDGDRVVFLGDSLTASRTYGEIVERYTVQSYPGRDIKFFNAGNGGDTAQGGLKRLDETVLVYKPTVVTVCYGINDIGWGMWATPEKIKEYYDGMREITRRCQKAGARVYILGPCATKLGDNETADAPDTSTLSQMSLTARNNAREMGAIPVDLYGEFKKIEWVIRESGREKDIPTHAPDGIHLSDLGNQIFAYILLKGMGAPDSVSDLTIDASSPSVKDARRCSVTDLSKEGNTLRFTRLDEGWPLFLGDFAWINFPFVPTHEKLSGFGLKVTGLPATSEWYKIRVNGEDLSTVTLTDLQKGINLGYMAPKPFEQFPPWKVQGNTVDTLTKARIQLTYALSSGEQIAPKEKLFTKKLSKDTQRQIANLERLQHQAAQPRPLAFEILPAEAPQPPEKK